MGQAQSRAETEGFVMTKHTKSTLEVLEELRADVNGKIERDMMDELDGVIGDLKRIEKTGAQSSQLNAEQKQRALKVIDRLLPAVTNIATLVKRFLE